MMSSRASRRLSSIAKTVASATTRGGAPGTRDTDLLRPEMSVQGVHAILLSGGSLFGLDAAGGAVNFLREHGIGLRFSDAVIPIVSQAITFRPSQRRQQELGAQAALLGHGLGRLCGGPVRFIRPG